MIHRVSIKSFKSLLDVELELGRVNVFVGANGSGKTNLLEAIGVLGAAANGRMDDEALLRRGVRPGVPALYKSSFKGVQHRPSIRLEAHTRDAGYEVALANPLKDPEPAWTFTHERMWSTSGSAVSRGPRSAKRYDPKHGLAVLKAVDWEPGDPASRLLKALMHFNIYISEHEHSAGPGARSPAAGARRPRRRAARRSSFRTPQEKAWQR